MLAFTFARVTNVLATAALLFAAIEALGKSSSAPAPPPHARDAARSVSGRRGAAHCEGRGQGALPERPTAETPRASCTVRPLPTAYSADKGSPLSTPCSRKSSANSVAALVTKLGPELASVKLRVSRAALALKVMHGGAEAATALPSQVRLAQRVSGPPLSGATPLLLSAV